MNNKNKYCCKDCSKRYIGCHDNCEDYKAYRKELDEANAKRHKYIQENSHFIDKKQKAFKIMRAQGKLK